MRRAVQESRRLCGPASGRGARYAAARRADDDGERLAEREAAGGGESSARRWRRSASPRRPGSASRRRRLSRPMRAATSISSRRITCSTRADSGSTCRPATAWRCSRTAKGSRRSPTREGGAAEPERRYADRFRENIQMTAGRKARGHGQRAGRVRDVGRRVSEAAGRRYRLGCPGSFTVKSASHTWAGPASMSTDFPKFDQGSLGRVPKLVRATDGQPVEGWKPRCARHRAS